MRAASSLISNFVLLPPHTNDRNDFPTLAHKKIYNTIFMASSIESAQRLTQDQLKQMLPELKGLPDGWKIKVDNEWVVYYEGPDGKTHHDHPTFGPLPSGWFIRFCKDPPGNDKRYPRYYDDRKKRKTYTTKNPRLDRKVFFEQNKLRKDDELEIAGTLIKTRKNMDLSKMTRQKIGNTNLRSKFHILHVIDDGGGMIGGMNGGVFVVKEKTAKPPEQLMVEKRRVMIQTTFEIQRV